MLTLLFLGCAITSVSAAAVSVRSQRKARTDNAKTRAVWRACVIECETIALEIEAGRSNPHRWSENDGEGQYEDAR
jgi:hypothetical protein